MIPEVIQVGFVVLVELTTVCKILSFQMRKKSLVSHDQTHRSVTTATRTIQHKARYTEVAERLWK